MLKLKIDGSVVASFSKGEWAADDIDLKELLTMSTEAYPVPEIYTPDRELDIAQHVASLFPSGEIVDERKIKDSPKGIVQ